MKIYNKSNRLFQVTDEIDIIAGASVDIEDALGKKLIALYPDELVDAKTLVGEVKKDDTKLVAELKEAKTKIAELEAEKEELNETIKALTGDIDVLNNTIEAQKKQLEAKKEPEKEEGKQAPKK